METEVLSSVVFSRYLETTVQSEVIEGGCSAAFDSDAGR